MDEGTGGNLAELWLKEALISFFLNGFHPFTGEKLNTEHEIVPKYVLPSRFRFDRFDPHLHFGCAVPDKIISEHIYII